MSKKKMTDAEIEKQRQEEFLSRNPQYREREKGLESVFPERFLIPGGAARSAMSKILPHQKPGAYRDPKKKREKDVEMRKRVKEADAKKDKLRATTPKGPVPRSPSRLPYEPRRQSDELYRKGGTVKSSASRRADGCAKKGKTRGKFV